MPRAALVSPSNNITVGNDMGYDGPVENKNNGIME
jgi:hypothetical protein